MAGTFMRSRWSPDCFNLMQICASSLFDPSPSLGFVPFLP
jgi:hypothetical protein